MYQPVADVRKLSQIRFYVLLETARSVIVVVLVLVLWVKDECAMVRVGLLLHNGLAVRLCVVRSLLFDGIVRALGVGEVGGRVLESRPR